MQILPSNSACCDATLSNSLSKSFCCIFTLSKSEHKSDIFSPFANSKPDHAFTCVAYIIDKKFFFQISKINKKAFSNFYFQKINEKTF